MPASSFGSAEILIMKKCNHQIMPISAFLVVWRWRRYAGTNSFFRKNPRSLLSDIRTVAALFSNFSALPAITRLPWIRHTPYIILASRLLPKSREKVLRQKPSRAWAQPHLQTHFIRSTSWPPLAHYIFLTDKEEQEILAQSSLWGLL